MIKRNINLFKIDHFIGGLWPMAAVVPIYFQQITNSYTLAMLVFSVCNIARSVAEIPTGLYSDKIGRRKTLMWAAGLILLCFVFWAAAGTLNSVPMLFIGAILWGISDAFMSGSIEALMYETMDQLGRKNDYDLIYSQSNMMTQVGLLVSMVIATVITYFFSMQTLAWVSVVFISGQLVTAFLYVEPYKKAKSELTSWRHFIEALDFIRHNKKLKHFSMINVLDGAVSMTLHRFDSLYFETLISVWAVNAARLIKQFAGAVSFAVVKRIRHLDAVRILAASVFSSLFLRIVFMLLNNVLTPFLISLTNLFYGTGQTAQQKLLQEEFTEYQRATMGSVLSFAESAVSAVFLVAIGALADMTSAYDAIFILVLGKAAVALLCWSAIRRYGNKSHRNVRLG